MNVFLLLLALALIVAALLMRRSTGLPWKRVTYSDTRGWQRTEEPMLARRYGLVGKPDYVLATGGRLIPVEVKPGRQAIEPYSSDLMQLAAYCLLVEETTGIRPPYGLLRYARATFRVGFDERLRGDLLALLQEMRAADAAIASNRSHHQAARCRNCGFVRECEQALV